MLPNKSPAERTQAFCHTSGRSGPTQHGWALCWSFAGRGQGQTVLSSEAWCPLLSSLRRLAEFSSLWVKNGGPSVLAGCWPRVTLMHSQALALWLAAPSGSLLWRPWGQVTYSEVLSDWSGSPRIISLLINQEPITGVASHRINQSHPHSREGDCTRAVHWEGVRAITEFCLSQCSTSMIELMSKREGEGVTDQKSALGSSVAGPGLVPG